MTPSKRNFVSQNQTTSDVAIRTNLLRDLYTVLGDERDGAGGVAAAREPAGAVDLARRPGDGGGWRVVAGRPSAAGGRAVAHTRRGAGMIARRRLLLAAPLGVVALAAWLSGRCWTAWSRAGSTRTISAIRCWARRCPHSRCRGIGRPGLLQCGCCCCRDQAAGAAELLCVLVHTLRGGGRGVGRAGAAGRRAVGHRLQGQGGEDGGVPEPIRQPVCTDGGRQRPVRHSSISACTACRRASSSTPTAVSPGIWRAPSQNRSSNEQLLPAAEASPAMRQKFFASLLQTRRPCSSCSVCF